MDIKLTATQRLQVTNVINQQTGNAGELRTLNRIAAVIELTEAEQKAVKVRFEATAVMWDREAADSHVAEIKLKKSDGDTLLKLLNSWGHFRRADSLWLDPLLEALEAAE